MKRPSFLHMAMIAGTMAASAPAVADEPPVVNAKQVAGLFMQSCVQFAGDRDGLRGWAKKTGLKELPGDVQDHFLYGLPGTVFDASNKDGKFVLVSEDGGSCSVLAETASGAAVITDLEQDMKDAQITFNVTGEKADAEEKALRHREYVASQGKREWLLLVSTVKDPAGGQAMLTANRTEDARGMTGRANAFVAGHAPAIITACSFLLSYRGDSGHPCLRCRRPATRSHAGWPGHARP